MKDKFGYKNEYELKFEKKFEEFKAWVIEHGYLPADKKSDSTQCRLAKWMGNTLRANTDYKSVLEEFVVNYKHDPNFRTYAVDRIIADFGKLKDYVVSTGNIPEEGSKLMEVLKNTAGRKCVEEEYKALFAKFGYGRSNRWIDVTLRMQKVREFYKKNGRLPYSIGEERELYKTVSCCRRWREKGFYQLYVNEIIEMGYDIDKKMARTSHEAWRTRLIDYLLAHDGMVPSASERKVAHDFHNFKRLHPEEYAKLIEDYAKKEK